VINITPREQKGSKVDFLSTADSGDVRGRVVNENGEPVEGVNVSVKGGANTVTTNSNGEFFIKAIDNNAVLVLTSVNMETFQVKVNGRSNLDVVLQTKITAMQEVVINKGYYTEKKVLATGNVSTIKSKDIQNQPVNNPLLALVARVPGVTIEQQTGFANSGIVVRVQGRNSINSGLDPLYVIDGVPYISQSLPTVGSAGIVLGNSGGSTTAAGNPLSLINPNDIESIDILKDADATAIYGSRGANGVILITTKKGKAGQTRTTANFRTGWGKVARKVDLLNSEQYLELRKEAYINDGLPVPNSTTTSTNSNYDLILWDQNRYTDWQKVLIGGTARYTDAQLSFSGGSTNTQFLISTGYHKESTVLPADFSDKKGSFQFSINHLSNNHKLKIQTSGIYVIDQNEIPNTDITSYAVSLAPNAPELYNADGSLNWAPPIVGSTTSQSWTNPLSKLLESYSNKVNNFIGSSVLSYQVLPNLTISSRFGYNFIQKDDISMYPLTSIRPDRRATTQRSARYGDGSSKSWIIEPQATYKVSIGKGNFEALLGTSFQKLTNGNKIINGSGYNSDLALKNISSASSITAGAVLYTQYRYNAIFGRFNYSYRDRYVLNFTARRDGSSRFGSENLFNNFWSLAGSWIFTNENWFSKNLSFLNFGKLRISYGTSGNDQIGDYGFMNLYNPVTSGVGVAYQGIPAVSPIGHSNPYLQWEETRKLQFGLDLGLLNNRIIGNVNYYLNRSSNLLVLSKLSYITGFDRINENFDGLVENRGWEFSLSSFNIRGKGLSWQTSLNLTVPTRNGHLASFPDLANTIYANTYTVGKSLNDQKVYRFGGVDPVTGIYLFIDEKGDVVNMPTVQNKIVFRNTTQKLFGGLQNNISYKGWELDFTFQFVKKDATIFPGNNPGSFLGTQNVANQPATILSRWKNPGDITTIQKVSTTYPAQLQNAFTNYAFFSDASFSDASFVRLTNLSLLWQLPNDWKKKAHLQSTRLFINAQNLFTITKYKGLDPSTESSNTLPPLQVFTLGAQVSF
jgi:TonB-linked SusC/RagA family outer membrane protein